MKKKLTKRGEQAIETKNRIYKEGLKLFKKDGYQNVSVDQIAKAAGIGIGTFYHYYKSKIELYMEVFINAEDYLKEFKDIDLTDKDPYEVLQKYFQQYSQLNEDPGLEFSRMISAPENRRFLNDNYEFETYLKEMISKFQEMGKITMEDTAEDICSFLFICARGTLYDWSIKNGKYVLKNKMYYVMGKVIKGILIS